MSPLFTRAKRRKNTLDEHGSVCVTVVLLDEDHKHKRGNITRSFLIESTCVSDVAAVLENIFGRQGEP